MRADPKALAHSVPYQTAAQVAEWRDSFTAAGDLHAARICDDELTKRGLFTLPDPDHAAQAQSARAVLRAAGVPAAGLTDAETLAAMEAAGYHWVNGHWSRA